MGILAATGLVGLLAHSPGGIGVVTHMTVTLSTMLLALIIAAAVGFVSASLPAYHASRLNIVDGLRYIG